MSLLEITASGETAGRKNVVWTRREKKLISSNMREAISLSNVSCDVAMIKVCLWSKSRAAKRLQTAFELACEQVLLVARERASRSARVPLACLLLTISSRQAVFE